MPIYRSFAALTLVLAIPYVVFAWHLLPCPPCELTGNRLLVGFGLAVAIPFVFLIVGIAAMLAGAFGFRRGLQTSRRVSAAFGVALFVFGGYIGLHFVAWTTKAPRQKPEISETARMLEKLRSGKATVGELRSMTAPRQLPRSGNPHRTQTRD